MVASNSQCDSRQLIFVVYDGIGNSVFAGQVVAPVISQLQKDPSLKATIISFESASPSETTLSSLPTHPRLQIKIESRFRFWGRWTLRLAAWRLKSFLVKFDRYTIIARGPLAGWMCKEAITSQCTALIIQARGLAAQEYAHTHPTGLLAKLRTWQYQQIEQSVYAPIPDSRITIQAVSSALKQFLIDKYHTPEKKISIAAYDIPACINPDQIQIWRTKIRTQLHIPIDALVYCYSGSAKSWQCPRETVQYFKQQQLHNPQALLLVLTHDLVMFKQLLADEKIPTAHYRLCTVQHHDIYSYLAAADIGLLFREAHILNWISRPTKALEYQAVGLQIIHNGTVGCLSDPK
jgi:hypothetical protein